MKVEFVTFVRWLNKEDNIIIVNNGKFDMKLPLLQHNIIVKNPEDYFLIAIYDELTTSDEFTIGVVIPFSVENFEQYQKSSGGVITSDKSNIEEEPITVIRGGDAKIIIGKDGIRIDTNGSSGLTITNDRAIVNGPMNRDNYTEKYSIIEKNPTTIFPIPDFPTAVVTMTSILDINGIMDLVKEIVPVAVELVMLMAPKGGEK